MCKFFVVPGNGQALLGMPITAVETQPSARVQNMCNTTQT